MVAGDHRRPATVEQGGRAVDQHHIVGVPDIGQERPEVVQGIVADLVGSLGIVTALSVIADSIAA